MNTSEEEIPLWVYLPVIWMIVQSIGTWIWYIFYL